jgi:hypothetical protein
MRILCTAVHMRTLQYTCAYTVYFKLKRKHYDGSTETSAAVVDIFHECIPSRPTGHSLLWSSPKTEFSDRLLRPYRPWGGPGVFRGG